MSVMSLRPVKDVCYYSCSLINITNVLLCILIILLLYSLISKKQLPSFLN